MDCYKQIPVEIGELFKIKRPVARSKRNYEAGEVPFVASGNYNNGIVDYLKPKEDEVLDKGNCITVSPLDGSAFYQKEDFLGRGGAGSAIIILYNDMLSEYSGLFISAVIRRSLVKYSYNDQLSSSVIVSEKIYLPVDNKKNPDWSYMENYMKEVEKYTDIVISQFFVASNTEKTKIDTKHFKRFHLYDEGLFTIDSGTKLDKAKMSNKNPSVNFVGRANANNGVTDYIDLIDGLEPYESGLMTISLGGEYLGSCFVQDKPFYTSQNVNVLIPQNPMSYYCKKYIAAMVFKEGRLHYKAFIDELNRHMKTDFTIPLPVDKNGVPDWTYMENYMLYIEKKAQNNIKLLNS